MAEPTNEQVTKKWLEIAKFVLPTVLAMAAGYGSFKASSAELNSEVAHLKTQVAETRRQVEDNRQRYVTMDILKAYLEGIKEQLNAIQSDIRARNRR